MSAVSKRNSAQIMRSRGTGALVGSMIGAGWMVYGLKSFPELARLSIGFVGLLALGALLVASRRLIAASRRLPSPDAAAKAAGRRVWTLFWINLLLEIVLLNVALVLLAEPSLHIYWIPAFSLVVGLHFFPMARFFSVPSYWICGFAMIAVAAAVAFVLSSGGAAAPIYPAAEALINAVILWSTAAWGIFAARLIAPSSGTEKFGDNA